MILSPKYVALDTATLANWSRYHWSSKHEEHCLAKSIRNDLQDRGIYIALSYSHLTELFQHEDGEVAKQRFLFLNLLPMIAWVRPRDHSWFVGGSVDVFYREIRAILHDGLRDKNSIVIKTRENLWETGVGEDMFQRDNVEVWDLMRNWAIESRQRDFQKARLLPKRSLHEISNFKKLFQLQMQNELLLTGDARLVDASGLAKTFSDQIFEDVIEDSALLNGDLSSVYLSRGVPASMVSEQMTIGEIGELCARCKQLEPFVKELGCNIGENAMELALRYSFTHRLTWLLSRWQQGLPKASASNLGDGHLLALSHYVDAMEVDKRTMAFIKQVKRFDEEFDRQCFHAFSSGELSTLIDRIDRALSNSA